MKGGFPMYFKVLSFLLFLIFSTQQSFAQMTKEEEILNRLRLAVELVSTGNFVISESIEIHCSSGIPEFYNMNGFNFIWNKTKCDQLIVGVKESDEEGLRPSDYHLNALMTYNDIAEPTTSQSVEKEILFTDAFLLYASHLLSGKIDPVKVEAEWGVIKREDNPVNILLEASINGNVIELINSLKPTYKSYNRLKAQLKLYREILFEEEWYVIPQGKTVKLGALDPRIPEIKKRLHLLRDLEVLRADSTDLFDRSMESAVYRFQRRHGIAVDGQVGKETIRELNTPIEKRIMQIQLNLERFRWLTKDLRGSYLMVNIPAFELEVVTNGKVEIEMDVAVGRPLRQTPVFSAKMTYMVFNPYWTVPNTILYEDLIPAQGKNQNFLRNNNIKVFDTVGNEIETSSVNWKAYSESGFPYSLRQEPGKNNALGVVKFVFPNPYTIYMHDTNHKEIFNQPYRAISSGCIRLAKPLVLAQYLLEKDGNSKKELINEILEHGQNFMVVLNNPYQVHVQYLTAYVDEHDILNFRKDIYNIDARALKALLKN